MEKIKIIIFYVMFFLLCLAAASTVNGYDYDLWARLVAGMGFVQTGHVLKHDFLSYTPTHLWYDHEWVSGVVFYIVQHYFSAVGILILQAFLISFIVFLIIKIIKLRGLKSTTPYNFLFFFFAYFAMNGIVNQPIRCQLFTFLFFTLFLYILELARKGCNRPLFLIPLFVVVWNNLHGGVVSGIGLILIYALGEFLNGADYKKYIYVFLSALLVLPINPWGFNYLPFLFRAAVMPRPDVVEWWGLFSWYYKKKFFEFKIFSLIILFSAFASNFRTLSFKMADKTKFLVLASTLYLAVSHVKLLPLFVISSSCFLYDDFYSVFNLIVSKLRDRIYNFTPAFSPNFALKKELVVYAAVLFYVILSLNSNLFAPLASWDKYPLKEVEFLKINGIKGKILINFGQGSYVAYKLYPNNTIYMDGRYEEVYPDEMLPLMRKFYLVKDGWEELPKKYPPDIMILEKTYPVYSLVAGVGDWKLVYNGKTFGVFIKTALVEKKYKQPSSDLNYYQKKMFDTDISFKKYS